MCGITGFIDLQRGTGTAELRATVKAMADRIRHRGPDDDGVWVDEATGVALGHRRLSILDLSPEGHQPMVSASGRYVIIFNGEIYNFAELRRELEALGHRYRGRSDTEVMLAAFEQWGVVQSVERFNGMLAFALWDRREQVLYLARDRLGEKPLYYGWAGRCLLFGSELKALVAHPDFGGDINRDALALYMRHNYVPAPLSIYRGIYQLPPGCTLRLDIREDLDDRNFSPYADPGAQWATRHPVRFWSARAMAERGTSQPFTGSAAEALDRLDAVLRDAVALRMVADVPVGAFLSGGIDSSTVVALMQALSNRPVKTFSIGFMEAGYNEAEYAKAVARHLGTDHTELYVTPAEAMAVIPRLPTLYDEPFADSSQIPTFLVAQLARQQVTVSLSGDAGDELFAGYTRYSMGSSLWHKICWLPGRLRRGTASALTTLSPHTWNRGFAGVTALLPGRLRHVNPGDKIHKLAEVMTAEDPEAIYLMLMSHWKSPASLVLGASELPTALTDQAQWANLSEFTHRMMYLDTVTYLPDDILTKVDRASMGVSLESRIPLLDPRVVEFAWQLPLSLKVRNGQSKWLLRQLLYRYVPRHLIERTKMGFGVPIDSWLRGPLQDWAESLLDETRLRQEGFFDPRPIRKKWAEHLSGRRNWQYYLWDVLMFQAWLAERVVVAAARQTV